MTSPANANTVYDIIAKGSDVFAIGEFFTKMTVGAVTLYPTGTSEYIAYVMKVGGLFRFEQELVLTFHLQLSATDFSTTAGPTNIGNGYTAVQFRAAAAINSSAIILAGYGTNSVMEIGGTNVRVYNASGDGYNAATAIVLAASNLALSRIVYLAEPVNTGVRDSYVSVAVQGEQDVYLAGRITSDIVRDCWSAVTADGILLHKRVAPWLANGFVH